MIPWIYLCYNTEFMLNQPLNSQLTSGGNSQNRGGSPESTVDKSKKQSQSISTSKVGGYVGGLGTSTNINKSGGGMIGGNDANQLNSNINESAMDIENEFGYCTEEDSIFHEFTNDEEKEIPRIYKQVHINKDIKWTQKEIQNIVKRVSQTIPSLTIYALFIVL